VGTDKVSIEHMSNYFLLLKVLGIATFLDDSESLNQELSSGIKITSIGPVDAEIPFITYHCHVWLSILHFLMKS